MEALAWPLVPPPQSLAKEKCPAALISKGPCHNKNESAVPQ
jgi:hypothetical protein